MSEKKKRSAFLYWVWRQLANVMATVVFKRKFLRNEIKGKKGPFVIVANHQAALDFINLMGATKEPMNFVISNSFYQTIPLKRTLPKLGLIPKQQFQTTLADMRRMRHVVEDDGILVIYPAGLMSDDGRSTPIPTATYGFFKWMDADIYVAKTIGTYFSMPKWRKDGIRAGRTYIDIYKLFDREELKALAPEEVQKRADEALLFDAYEEQDKLRIKYRRGSNIEGLENVLYICPHCKQEFTIQNRDKNKIFCASCGYEETADKYQLLHKTGEVGEEIRYPSRWNEFIYSTLKSRIESGELSSLSCEVEVQTIPEGKRKFETFGNATLTLSSENFVIKGILGDREEEIRVPIASFAALPYKPGKYIEIQDGDAIYRCLPTDGRVVIKFINMVKIFYEISTAEAEKRRREIRQI